MQEDFGPIAVVLEDGENSQRHVNWHVSDTHALPICGPPLSERIVFVLRPLHTLRSRALPAVRTPTFVVRLLIFYINLSVT